MAAVVCRDQNLDRLDELLRRIKREIGRRDDQKLTWKKVKRPEHRAKIAEMLGSPRFIQIAAVIVCKRHLQPPIRDKDAAYLYTFRFLLERLSWLGARHEEQTKYTLSHIKGFKARRLPEYEANLRLMGTATEIKWDYLDPLGGRISNDSTTPRLQLADLATSAVARAFNSNLLSPPDQGYLLSSLPSIFRGPVAGRANVLTSYGLKMHPWTRRPDVQALYPWLLPLR